MKRLKAAALDLVDLPVDYSENRKLMIDELKAMESPK